jgi:GNAT superfamily N-acetyltransferase
MPGEIITDRVNVVPANQASWEDIQAIFGMRGYPSACLCQRFKIGPSGWTPAPREERAFRLHMETECGHPRAKSTSGLVGYLEDEPVGWCAVEPRTAYPRLPPQRVKYADRGEDPGDPSVWAVTCFVTRAGYRGRGVTRAMVRAAVDLARRRGARALEGYPMITEPGKEITWGETHVGTRNIFADVGFSEVYHPTLRRVVMRIDFKPRKA